MEGTKYELRWVFEGKSVNGWGEVSTIAQRANLYASRNLQKNASYVGKNEIVTTLSDHVRRTVKDASIVV